MSTAGLNSLALRFGGFGHAGGGVGFVVLLLIMSGMVIWAIAGSNSAGSQKS
jgi:hypothetical protein